MIDSAGEKMMSRTLSLSLCLCLLLSSAAFAQNWPQFRGAGALGNGDGKPTPAAWDATKNQGVRWKTKIPGLAHSSPVVWGDRIYLTTAVSSAAKVEERYGLYGDVEPVKDEPAHTWRVLALDKRTGKILWDKVVHEGLPKTKRHTKATHASSTPATDGKYVVSLFGSQGLLVAHDTSGKQVWKQDIGVLDSGWFYDTDYQWSHASSPVIYKNLVIVQADIQKDSFIAAYDLKTGKQVWRTSRADEIPSWSTPTVFESKGRAELIANGTKFIRGYDALTGKELWRIGPNSEIATPTPFVAHDLIYVTSGYRPIQPIYAIRLGATGDLTLKDGKDSSDFVAWSKPRGGPYMPTPIVYGEHLYTLSNNGVVVAYNAKTGERLYQERLAGRGGAFTASPVAADGKLYFSSEDGEVFVVKAGPKYEYLGENKMGEVIMATPAVSDGTLFVRTTGHLYAIGGDAPAPATKSAQAGK
jgi:outer membrane protein assembly factor BamB